MISVYDDSSPVNFINWINAFIPGLSLKSLRRRSIILPNKSYLLDKEALNLIQEEWDKTFPNRAFPISSPSLIIDFEFLLILQFMIRARLKINDLSGLESLVLFRERHRIHLIELLEYIGSTIKILFAQIMKRQ